MFTYKRGNVYYIKFKDRHGKWQHESTKKYTEEEAKVALEIKKETYVGLVINEFPVNGTKLSGMRDKVEEWMMKNRSPKTQDFYSKKTIEDYKNSMTYLMNLLGDINIKNITKREIEKYVNFKLLTVQKNSINVDLRHLKASFNIAKKELGLIGSNPVAEIPLFPNPNKNKKPLAFNENQVIRLFDACKNDRIMFKVVSIGYYTGIRLGEVLNLQYGDLDIENRIMSIRNKDEKRDNNGCVITRYFRTKSGIEREISMCTKLIDMFADANSHKPVEYVITTRETKTKKAMPYVYNHISKKFKALCRELNLPEKFHFHSLRHTFGSTLVGKNIDLISIKELMGHASIKTTELYMHGNMKNKENAVNTL